ncbi:Glu-tRNA(Gln) amidotransferase subunit GatD [Nanoarchaeota archaeon]
MEAGSRVKVQHKDETLEGVLIPSEDPKFVVVKLDNGYNIGFKKSSVKISKISGPVKAMPKGAKKVRGKGPKITILHTGGTIASKVDYKTGAVTSGFEPSEILAMFPELADIATIDSKLVRHMMSEDMRFEHYNLLVKEVEKEVKKGAKGIIITHGTDTLHYTSAALSFALENVPVPVMLVGSQRSSDRPSTDSYVNLVSAAIFIANTKMNGVFTCMHESMGDDTCLVIHGCKARKMHTSRRDAFRPINMKPVARVDYEKKKVQVLQNVASKGTFKATLFNPKLKIGLLKCHTNMFAEEFSNYKGFDGLVLEIFALGQGPTTARDDITKEHAKIAKEIQGLASKIPVVAASSCIYGRVDMDVYAEGRELQKLGVIGNNLDMTPETAFIKLAWLLSNHKKDVKSLYMENLRGEITNRTEQDTFLA